MRFVFANMQVTVFTGPFALQDLEMSVCYTQSPPYSRWHAMTLVSYSRHNWGGLLTFCLMVVTFQLLPYMSRDYCI